MTITLKAESRTIFGKALKGPKEAGKLPVVIYGPKESPQNFFVETKEFKKVFRNAGESSVVTLDTPEGEKDTLIKDVAMHPVSGEPVHVDFYVIEKGKKVEVAVPLVFVGESPAVKNLNGTLVKVIHELEIEAMPKDLPHEIEVDISSLVDFDSRILVKDLKIPQGVEVMVDGEETVALAGEAGEEVLETAEPVDLSAIELTEKKGKKDEEGEEGAE
ncbi:MAG: 50S ribosomal protein L25 [Candidatus Vogelbacteria bacterium]|jgi:large subunit ribosomal protein L25|nr:50S ribosomal protein L25 [Candidatus Vogelbacteria bacterium]